MILAQHFSAGRLAAHTDSVPEARLNALGVFLEESLQSSLRDSPVLRAPIPSDKSLG